MPPVISKNKRSYLDAVVACIQSLHSKPIHLLEAGIGVGQTTAVILASLQSEDHLTAVDLDHKNLTDLKTRAAAEGFKPQIRYLVADACNLTEVADAAMDLVCSDSMLNMLGTRFTQWFIEARRVLRPGGHFVFREMQPPESPGKTSRDLFLRILMATRQLIGNEYAMVTTQTIESALAEVGFQNVKIHRSAEPDGLPLSLEQWFPLSNIECPLRTEFLRYFDQARMGLNDGPPLSASYHVTCVK